MSAIGLQPIRMRDATLHVAADDYTAQINLVIFVPEYEVLWSYTYESTHGTPVPGFHRWWVHLGLVQDLLTPLSLSTYLIENAASRRVATFSVPGTVVAATVMLLPGQVGGTIGQVPVATVALPCYADPDISTDS